MNSGRDLPVKEVSVLKGNDRYYLEGLIHVSTLSLLRFQVRLCQEKEDFLSLC